ncbi:MAG: hypothetical protein ACREMX_09800, partial [Gemmatimonadales bacterium]
MERLTIVVRRLNVLLVPLIPIALAAQTAEAPADTGKGPAADPAPEANYVGSSLSGFTLSGYAEASYSYSSS